MEKHEIDLDNFIKGRIAGLYPRGFPVEPTPDFCRRVMKRILSLEKRKCFYALYGWAVILALGPLALRQLWLWIRNDYFSVSGFPFSHFVVPAYHFLISSYGIFLLFTIGMAMSLRFILKTRRGEYGAVIKTA